MGVTYKRVAHTEVLPVYPEADDKIAYYEDIISQLEGFYSAGSSVIPDAYRNSPTFKTGVENSDAEGAYYDEYVTHKDNWFSDNSNLYSDFWAYLGTILTKKGDAQTLKADWEYKKTLTYVSTYYTYEPEEDDEEN